MPSVNVPLKGQPGWDQLMAQRKKFWSDPKNNQLTPHFKATEFFCHDGSPPPTRARAGMVKLCKEFLEPMRAKFGGSCLILSGYRHTLYNASIGGARNSQHIYDDSYESVAADTRYPKGTPAAWGTYAKTLRTKRTPKGAGGVGIYPKSGFCHIDNRPYQANWSG